MIRNWNQCPNISSISLFWIYLEAQHSTAQHTHATCGHMNNIWTMKQETLLFSNFVGLITCGSSSSGRGRGSSNTTTILFVIWIFHMLLHAVPCSASTCNTENVMTLFPGANNFQFLMLSATGSGQVCKPTTYSLFL